MNSVSRHQSSCSQGSRIAIALDDDSIEDEDDIVELSQRLNTSASLSAGPSAYTTGTSANLTRDSLFSSVANTTRANVTKDSIFSSFTASANVNATKDSIFSDSEADEDAVSGLVVL